MGLDTLELVLSVEETFDVSISDEQAQQMRTVGDIYLILMERCPVGDATAGEACLTGSAFYRLRRGLCDVLRLGRRQVRPDTSLEALLPARTRRQDWECLREALTLHLPQLRRPRWLSNFLFYGPLVAVGLAAVWLVVDRPGQLRDGWPALAIWGAYLGVEGYVVTRRDAICLPAEFRTAGDVARYLLDRNYGKFRGQVLGWHHRDIWHRLVVVISECLAVEPAKITPQATIVGDLGAS